MEKAQQKLDFFDSLPGFPKTNGNPGFCIQIYFVDEVIDFRKRIVKL